MSITENGVQVALPSARRLSAARKFLIQHKEWIGKHYKQVLENQQKKQDDLQRIPDKLDLLALGEVWTVERIDNDGSPLCLKPRSTIKTLFIEGSSPSPASAHELLRRWLHRYARFHILPWVARVAVSAGLKPTRIRIRNQKSRHGSCSGKGSINLNQQLLFYPPPLVNNVILHELCHLRHQNHSKQFWSLLASYDPDYKKHNRQIRDYEKKVPAWTRAAS